MERILQKQLNSIVNIIIIFFAVITLPGMGISLSRVPAIGFLPEMYFHIALTLFVILLAFFREIIPYSVKTWITVTALMIMGYGGFFSIGLSSSGRLDVVIGIAFACFFISLRVGIILAVVNILLFTIVAYLHVNGYTVHDIDFNTYNYAAKSWIAAFYNFSSIGIVIVLLTGLANQQLRKNLKSMSDKKNQLHKEIIQRKIAEEKYKKLSVTDPLTNLYNRRYFFEKANEEITRSERYDRPLSIIMIDADYFKNINDEHGHQAGDFILKSIAERLLNNLRPCDVPARFGGEEFCLLMPETDIEMALHVAERLRHAIADEQFTFEDKEINLTCSFGVAEKNNDEHTVSSIISRADNALYNAKNEGRNKIVKA